MYGPGKRIKGEESIMMFLIPRADSLFASLFLWKKK
jgi:hypothetical protein